MSYVKFEHRSLGEARWLDATPEAFTLHVYALDWCQEQASDGHIPDKAARRLSCPVDPSQIPAAWDILVNLGAWERDDDGYRCPDFLAHGIAAEEQDATRSKWAEDKRRQRLCRVGNHSICTPRSKCPVAMSTSGQVERSPLVHPKTSGRLDQTRPDQTPKGSGSGIGESSSAGALDSAEVGENDPHTSPSEVPEIQALHANWASAREAKKRRRMSPVRTEDAS